MKSTDSLISEITENLIALPEYRLADVAAYTSRLRNGQAYTDHDAYRELIDEIPNLVWQLSKGGRTKYVNRRWRDYFGRAEGMTEDEWRSVVHPEDFGNFFARWQVVNEAGLLDPLEVRLRRHDGEYRWFSKRARAVRDQAGNLDYWIFTATEIHGSKQVEEALRVEGERLSLAVRAGQIGVWDLIPATGVLTWDEVCRAAFGLDPHVKIDYQVFLSGLHPEDRERVQELIASALDPCGNGTFEADYRTVGLKDGVVRNIHAEGRVIFGGHDQERRAIRFVGVVKDVTKRIRSEEELLQANLDLQQFAYAAAHDLQEPLRNISLSLGLLKLRHAVGLDESGMRLVETSIEGAKRIHGMITDLLAFTRVTTGAFAENLAPVDANRVLQSVVSNLQLAIVESGAEIKATTLPLLAVYETHLLQLFQNIIGNAIKYRRKDHSPFIELSAERRLGDWLFSVKDNGIGFDEVHKDRIFGVFKRLHHRHEYPGTGIGLAICSRIVASYGGRIWAQGEVNQGATIFFTLPGQRH